MAKIAKKSYSGAFYTEEFMKNDVFSRFQSNFDQLYHNLYDSVQQVVKNSRENMFLRRFLCLSAKNFCFAAFLSIFDKIFTSFEQNFTRC